MNNCLLIFLPHLFDIIFQHLNMISQTQCETQLHKTKYLPVKIIEHFVNKEYYNKIAGLEL